MLTQFVCGLPRRVPWGAVVQTRSGDLAGEGWAVLLALQNAQVPSSAVSPWNAACYMLTVLAVILVGKLIARVPSTGETRKG